MAAIIGRFSRFFGRTVSESAAFGIGAAIHPTLGPLTQEVANETRARFRVYPLSHDQAAQLVAQSLWSADRGDSEAAFQGIDAQTFSDVVKLVQRAPGLADAIEGVRRGLISDAQFEHALDKAQIEPQYHAALKDFVHAKLSPADIANAVQQGFVPGGSILAPPPSGGLPYSIPFEEVPIDPLTEWEDFGIDPERGKVLAQLSGLPPGPMELLDMWRRGIITEESVDHGIREGHLKTKWTSALKALRYGVLSGIQVANLRLRAWITDTEMYALGEKAGYDHATMDKLVLGQGRPITFRQVFIGEKRGGTYNGSTAQIDPAFLKSLQESDIRPEWYNLAWAQRHTYPSAFVIRALASSGDLTPAETEGLLLKIGWPEDLAHIVPARWAAGKAGGGKAATTGQLLDEYEGRYITEAELLAHLTTLGYSPEEAQIEAHLADARRVKKARDGVVKAIHDSLVKHEIQEAEAVAYLTDEGIPQEAIDLLIAEWTREAAVTRKSLTPTQIKRAFDRGVITRDVAVQDLVDLGYNPTDAATLLDTPA